MREKGNSYTNPKCHKIRPINSYRNSKSAVALSLNAIHNICILNRMYKIGQLQWRIHRVSWVRTSPPNPYSASRIRTKLPSSWTNTVLLSFRVHHCSLPYNFQIISSLWTLSARSQRLIGAGPPTPPETLHPNTHDEPASAFKILDLFLQSGPRLRAM